MSDTALTPEQNEEQTKQYLKTNGPPPGAFAPDPSLEPLLEGKSELEKLFYRSQSTGLKQGDWVIREIAGLKSAHRTIHQKMNEIDNQFASGEKRFQNIDATLAVFTAIRDQWLTRKAVRAKIAIGLITLLVFPFLSLFLVEVAKRLLHWK